MLNIDEIVFNVDKFNRLADAVVLNDSFLVGITNYIDIIFNKSLSMETSYAKRKLSLRKKAFNSRSDSEDLYKINRLKKEISRLSALSKVDLDVVGGVMNIAQFKATLTHCKLDYIVSLYINSCLGNYFSCKDLFRFTAFSHDIYKIFDSSRAHSRKSGEIFKRFISLGGNKVDGIGSRLTGFDFSSEEFKFIYFAILYHNRGSEIKFLNFNEDLRCFCSIFHDADKISKIFKRKIWVDEVSGGFLSDVKIFKELCKIPGKLLLSESLEVYRELLIGLGLVSSDLSLIF